MSLDRTQKRGPSVDTRGNVIMGSEGDPKTNLTGPYKLFFAQFMFFYILSQASSSISKPKTFPFLCYINKSCVNSGSGEYLLSTLVIKHVY